MMRWEKLGLLWQPTGEPSWAQTHATLPVVDAASPSEWRVLVGARDAAGKSRIGRLRIAAPEFGATTAPAVQSFDRDPVLSLGEPGTFDDSGVMPSWLVCHDSQFRLYYIGWNIVGTVPYRVSIGLAISDDGGETYRRHSPGPVLDRNRREPYFATTPCVLGGADRWRMWYASCTGWRLVGGRWEPSYHIKYAESDDGLDWHVTGISCIDAGADVAICRPCVWPRGDGFAMLYSHRSLVDYRTRAEQGYRIGYAESPDGIHWQRLDEHAGVCPSQEGWDSQMQQYCWIERSGAEAYLFYNGNGFGQSGVGVARSVVPAGVH